MRRTLISLIAAASFSSGYSLAEDISFSPAPITKIASAGEAKRRLDVSYFSVDIQPELVGYGVNFTKSQRSVDGLSGSRMNLNGGTMESDTMDGFNMGFAAAWDKYVGASGNTILSLGVILNGLSLSSVSDAADFDLTSYSYGLQAIAQHHMPLGNKLTLVPFASVNALMVTSETTIYAPNLGYIDTSTDTSLTTTSFGFDIFFDNISLGLLATAGGDSDVTFITAGFNF